MAQPTTVATINPVVTAYLPQQTIANSITVRSPLLAIPAQSGTTSTEGVDMLTYRVSRDGLYLVYYVLTLVSPSNSDDAHTGSAYVAYTPIYGLTDGQSATCDGIPNTGLDMKGTPADGTGGNYVHAQLMPVHAAQGTDIVLSANFTNAGSDATQGTYRVNLAVVQI